MINIIRYFLGLGLFLLSTVCLAVPEGTVAVISRTELMRVIVGLLVVLLMIGGLSWLIKRLNIIQLGSTKGCQIITSTSLGPKEKVILLKIGGRHLLIGVGAAAINLLYDFGETLPVGVDAGQKSSFTDFFTAAMRKS